MVGWIGEWVGEWMGGREDGWMAGGMGRPLNSG